MNKDECYGAVKTISDRINSRDPDMMSHVIMSVFKVASAEANVPGPRPTTRDARILICDEAKLA